MRSSNYFLATVAGFGLIVLGMPRTEAMTIASPASFGAGLGAVNPIEPAHCLSDPHEVVGGHGWSTGCKEVIVPLGHHLRSEHQHRDRHYRPCGQSYG